ncbi:carboxylesterase family protein [soil metagenome]
MRKTICSLAVLLISASIAAAETSPTAVVEGGTVSGAISDGVAAFTGIPYAAPPLGDLRWRAPQPVPPWSGVRAATEYGHDCMQVAIDDEAAPPGATPAEDCLVLNVWRPAELAAGAKLPVMVWIPGGGFVNGGSSTPVSSGAELAKRGIVVVSINYRLGRLGFFAHPALLAAKEGPVGNFGYMDQIAALKWVQTNIATFGGDPAKVTLVGESAGGASVLQLLVSPVTKGLFRAVVVMSGGGRKALTAHPMAGSSDAPGPLSAEQMDADFARSLGIDGKGPATLKELREVPAEQVIGDISLPSLLQAALVKGARDFPGTPMTDGTIVRDELGTVLRSGGAPRVPILIGTTALEMPLFFPSRTDPFSFFGADAGKAKPLYNPGGAVPPELVLLGISADMTMHEPARFAAKAMSAAGSPAWLYRFTYLAESVAERARGAAHAQEVPYLFDRLQARYGSATTARDRAAATAFSSYVVNFVKTGDPNGTGLPQWPKFDPARFDLMNFTLDDGPVFGPDPRAARIELVERSANRGMPSAK